MFCPRKTSRHASAILPHLKLLDILGYSLLEVLVVFSLISIILAFTLPHYTSCLVKVKRLLAITLLEKAASELEIFYTQHHSYVQANLSQLGLNATADKSYILRLVNKQANSFVVALIPQGKQASADTACGIITLDSQGRKTITGSSTVAQCWHL